MNIKVQDYKEFLDARALECHEILFMIDDALGKISNNVGFIQRFKNRKRIAKILFFRKAIDSLLISYAKSSVAVNFMTKLGEETIEISDSSEYFSEYSIPKSVFSKLCDIL